MDLDAVDRRLLISRPRRLNEMNGPTRDLADIRIDVLRRLLEERQCVRMADVAERRRHILAEIAHWMGGERAERGDGFDRADFPERQRRLPAHLPGFVGQRMKESPKLRLRP